jgi:glycosyltransferase involved in cell wall biosynthesis
MVKKVKKLIKTIIIIFDYIIFVFVFPFCLVAFLFAIPWILKQRRIWNYSVKGNPKALILHQFTLEKVTNRGYELLLPYRNPSIKWLGYLDTANSQETNIKITDDFYLMTWKSPKIVEFMKKIKFGATSIIFRELIAVFKATSYCVKNQIGVLRVYKHDYPALQACLISSFIKIPSIVEIIGNFEVIHRLTGKVYYFRELNKLPLVKIFARRAENWLLGLPLRRAFHVLGRDLSTYDHALALGTPIDKLSLLRIINFNTAFNSYNPEQPPAKPAEYPYLLFVGRLVDIKYPLDVLAAFDIAAPHLPEYRLVIIGDGALRDNVEQRKEISEYKDRIVLLGACSSDIVFHWTAHATVAICPFSGSTVVEAMLCGKPIISYLVAGQPELFLDDYNGYIVPFRNIEALAEKIVHVVRNYEEARIVGRRSRELARVAYDKDKIREKESMIYKQALTDSQN